MQSEQLAGIKKNDFYLDVINSINDKDPFNLTISS